MTSVRGRLTCSSRPRNWGGSTALGVVPGGVSRAPCSGNFSLWGFPPPLLRILFFP